MSRGINAKKFSRVMRELGRAQSQVAAVVARDIHREIQANFDRGTDYNRKPWLELSEDYMEATGRHHPPLTDTGAGRRSIRVMPNGGAGLRIVVGVKYMIYHQFGGPSHLRGPGRSALARYRNRKKNPGFGTEIDRSSGRRKPPQRAFIPWDKWPVAWSEIYLFRLEQLAAKRIGARG
jgi:hypothetical protein